MDKVARYHRRRIAVRTLQLNDVGAAVLGGMTKDEAREVLRQAGVSDEQIAKIESGQLNPRPLAYKGSD